MALRAYLDMSQLVVSEEDVLRLQVTVDHADRLSQEI